MTKTDKTRSNVLTPQQATALEALATGSNISAAAEVAGVTRQTASEWYYSDGVFIAALNRRRLELWAESADSYRALLPLAYEVLKEAMKKKDTPEALRAALSLIKFAAIPLTPTGPTTVEDAELDQKKIANDRLMRSVGIF